MSEVTPFGKIFRPALDRFCFATGKTPTHLLIGPKEYALFATETQQNHYHVEDPSCTKCMYGGVEILRTYDTDSILHFFVR